MNQIVIVLNVIFQTGECYMKEKFYESGKPEEAWSTCALGISWENKYFFLED
jgi:hypothetical protein